MKKFGLSKQRLGEGVRIYKKTEEDEDFVEQARFVDTTRDATEKLIKCLAPKAGPKNRAKKLVKTGEKMQEDKFGTLFGRGVSCVGESLKNMGHEYAELENRIQIHTINPLKSFRDGDLKELLNLKKRYEMNRLEYDSAKRVYASKGTPENEDKMRRAKTRYEEAKEVYYEKLQHSQDEDQEHVENLKAYAQDMIEYHRKCMEIFQATIKELDSIAPSSKPGSRKGSFDAEAHIPPHMPPTESIHSRPQSMMVGQPQPYQPNHAPAIPQYQQYPPPQSQSPQFNAAPGYGQPPVMPVRPAPQPGPIGTGHGAQMPPSPRAAEQPALPIRPRSMSNSGPRPIERCRALYDYEPVEVPNGISIKQGDVITILNKTPSGWWEGEVRGQTGFFPSNYVQPM